MPKLIDYAARFDLMREAVYEITLRDGPTAITLPAVAAHLNTSVSSLRRVLRSAEELPLLGFQWAERQRRRRLFDHWAEALRGPEPVLRPVNSLLRGFPRDRHMAEQDLAWWLLVDAFGPDQAWAREARADHELALDGSCEAIVGCLGLDESEARDRFELLRAVVAGTTSRVFRGLVAPDAGFRVLRCHVVDLLGEAVTLSDGDAA